MQLSLPSHCFRIYEGNETNKTLEWCLATLSHFAKSYEFYNIKVVDAYTIKSKKYYGFITKSNWRIQGNL